MIRLIREGSRKYPWILVTIMGVIVVTFIVGMGWWGYGQIHTGTVAVVGDSGVSIDEYRRTYRNMYDFYKENVKQEEINDEELRQTALQTLIDGKVWLLAAEEMGLTVTPEELRADIIKRPEFQREGRFDPQLYQRLLAANRLTPALFETLQREYLLAEKARQLVRSSVALTPSERQEAESLASSAALDEQSSGPLAKEFLTRNFLLQKQQRALTAYLQMMKARIPIEIYRENT